MNGKINVGSNEKVTIDGEKVKEKINLETFKGDNPLMLGSAGYTFPAKTLLKDGLQIINGVNGEDLTDTVADQTTAVEELMKVVSRKIAMNNGEGQYVWKKSEYIAGGNLALTVLSNKQIQVSSGEVDITNLTNAKLDGVSGTLNSSPVSFTNTTMTINVASINYSYEYSYDSTTGIITLVTSSTTAIGNSGNGTLVITESYIFLDYVVSSDESAYPNGGTLDGYWYELVEEGLNLPALFGCTDMAVDTFTVSSATLSENVTINHSLGKIPKIALIVKEDMNTTTNMFNYYLNGAFFFNRRQGTRAQVVTEWYSYSSTGWYNDHSASVYANNISSNSFIIYSVDSGSAARRFAASSYKVITMA